MDFLRTPDERFVDLPDYDFAPHYVEIDGARMHYVDTENGDECSSTAIRALIKKLVSAELPAKPLSDSKMAEILADQGINVARRTIAKYRESLSIPPSNQRKSLL